MGEVARGEKPIFFATQPAQFSHAAFLHDSIAQRLASV
jgi:hypothetical protein